MSDVEDLKGRWIATSIAVLTLAGCGGSSATVTVTRDAKAPPPTGPSSLSPSQLAALGVPGYRPDMERYFAQHYCHNGVNCRCEIKFLNQRYTSALDFGRLLAGLKTNDAASGAALGDAAGTCFNKAHPGG